MASLRDSVKDYQEELRDGIAWVAFWKEGRSWNAELFHLEVDGTLEPFDRSRLEEIKAADPAAVILNGYYCGHLGENMSLDELTAVVRYHYENSRNDLDGFIGAHDDRPPPEVIEEARAAAHAAGLPFSEKPYRDGEDFDPYVFDGSMSIEDYELMHRMIEKERSEQMDEWKTGYSSYDHDRLEAADKMKIERGIYFDTKGADISPLTALPLAELVKLREESAAAEQTVFENLKVQASAWKNNFGRNVMKGQKGIKILAPSPFKIKKEMEKIDPQTGKAFIGKDGKPVTEEKEITIPAFKVVSVFDVSQTEGKEIPDIAVNMLTGDVEHYKDVFAALEKTSPVPVGFEKIEGGAHGYYHLEDKRIALDEGMSELQTLKTLIHEIAHAKLHDIDLNAPLENLENRPDRRTREVQAESIAYTVCQHYGLDTSDYSFGYLAGWSAGRELTELKSSLETIRSTAAEIINSIDEHIAELQKEQVQDAPREKAAMPEYIYKIEANPRTTGDNDRFFLQAYLPQENGRAKIGDVLYIGSLAKCRELMGGLNAGELTQGEVKELYAKAQEAEADKDTFSIYQLKQGDETRDFRFEPYNRLQAAGNVVDKANYELVYSAELTPGTSLEDIYTRFNIDHPKDFKGHSLSVSDVVVLHQNGQDAAHYVDSFGYKEVPEFLQEQTQQPEKINPLKHVEDTIEQNDNNFDGIINNTPTVDELEAKVKAGEQISLVDLAEAIKADKERGKEKPSIRAQLKADKERTGKKKNAKQKSQDLERS